MSYCRWSSDNWKCDVYVYEDVNGGWTTHVAGRRRLKLDTLPQSPYDLLTGGSVPENWNEIYRAYHDALGKLPFEDITLPHAGESFNDATPQDCADRLKELRALIEQIYEAAAKARSEMDVFSGSNRSPY